MVFYIRIYPSMLYTYTRVIKMAKPFFSLYSARWTAAHRGYNLRTICGGTPAAILMQLYNIHYNIGNM